MAITGLIWFGYLILHLWGNLKIYAGAPYLNDYAAGYAPSATRSSATPSSCGWRASS